MIRFLAFSTCNRNALSTQALHLSCEAGGVNTAKKGVWKQAVYKAHLDRAELRVNWRGQLQNRGLVWKDEGGNTANLPKEDMLFSVRTGLWILPLAILLFLGSGLLQRVCRCVCVCLSVCV